MTRVVLLDANLIIGAFEGEAENEAHIAAKARLEELTRDPDVKFAITPLIRYEVMRGVRRVEPAEMERLLNGFTEFEIRSDDARLAALAYKLAKDDGHPIKKREEFDLLHCVCARLNGLEIASMDADIARLLRYIDQVH
jgi:predicted nucleic acid-binding protein